MITLSTQVKIPFPARTLTTALTSSHLWSGWRVGACLTSGTFSNTPTARQSRTSLEASWLQHHKLLWITTSKTMTIDRCFRVPPYHSAQYKNSSFPHTTKERNRLWSASATDGFKREILNFGFFVLFFVLISIGRPPPPFVALCAIILVS